MQQSRSGYKITYTHMPERNDIWNSNKKQYSFRRSDRSDRSIDRSYSRQDLQVAVIFDDGLGGEAPPARRAGAVRDEPPVDARDVEPVPAHGEHPDPLPIGELRQADGAPLWPGYLLPRRRRRGDVGGHGQRDDVLALEPGAGAAARGPAHGVGHSDTARRAHRATHWSIELSPSAHTSAHSIAARITTTS